MASVSAAAVLIIGAVIGVYMWKQRIIRNKRKGEKNDVLSLIFYKLINNLQII